MNYNITGKHLDISDAVRSYVELPARKSPCAPKTI